MRVGDAQWRSLICDGAGKGGILIGDRQVDLMSRHAEALLEWNRKINLTAIVDPVEIAVKHFLDSIWPHPLIPLAGRLLDIGTGGGFPGIPLKILRPEQSMLLIDGVRKKINFVRDVIRRLELQGVAADHIRAEELARKEATVHDGFDVVICRALKDPVRAARMAAPLLAPGGQLWVYQGPAEEWAPEALPPDFRVTDTHAYSLPFTGDRRTLVVISRR